MSQISLEPFFVTFFLPVVHGCNILHLLRVLGLIKLSHIRKWLSVPSLVMLLPALSAKLWDVYKGT